MRRWYREYGAIAAGAVDHHAEYLPFMEDIRYATTPPYHGTESEREQRLLELREVGEGIRDWREVLSHGSWEHPVDVAVLLKEGKRAKVDILNIRNDGGSLPQLPSERIVEVPVKVEDGKLFPMAVPPFPPKLAELLRTISDVHELAAAAAVSGDISIARKAIEIDPAIIDKQAAYSALERMLAAHADMLPQFAAK
jgi:alpha-galactosidase/6-phospho-beta-glucosidase family protein